MNLKEHLDEMARIDLFKWWKARAEKWPRLVGVARSMFACNAYVEDVTVQALETDEQTLWLNFCRENWSNVTRHNYDVSKQMLKINKREEKKAAGEEESEEEESAPSSRSSSDPSSGSGSDSGSSVAARTGHTPNTTPSPPESLDGSDGSAAALNTTLLPGSPGSTADLNLHLSDQSSSDSTSPTPGTSKTVKKKADSSNIPMSRTPSPTASTASAPAISAEPGSSAAAAEPEPGVSVAPAPAHSAEPGSTAAIAEPEPGASATPASAISAEPSSTVAIAEPEQDASASQPPATEPAVVRIEPGTGEPIRTARRQLFTMTEPPTHEDDPNEETYNYWELG